MLLPYLEPGRLEAGCDEAGRGCLAGPVFAAAVILPDGYTNDLLNDSKKLSEHARDALRPVIERDALAWAVGIVDNDEIDHINILQASFLAMNLRLICHVNHIFVHFYALFATFWLYGCVCSNRARWSTTLGTAKARRAGGRCGDGRGWRRNAQWLRDGLLWDNLCSRFSGIAEIPRGCVS